MPARHAAAETYAAGDADVVLDRIKRMVVAEAGDIILAAIEKAKKGHYQCLKYLFELAGLYPAVAEKMEENNLSLARTLCDQLGLPAEDEGVPKTSSKGDESIPMNGHALE
jgi:hypothetical protein